MTKFTHVVLLVAEEGEKPSVKPFGPDLQVSGVCGSQLVELPHTLDTDMVKVDPDIDRAALIRELEGMYTRERQLGVVINTLLEMTV